MKSCAQCQQQNQEDAKFCYQCGNTLTVEPEVPIEPPAASAISTEEDLWRQFIGPNADRYLHHFRKFGLEDKPKFTLTWNWPAFLYVSFLWFLYRKMYTYALVYAVGPMVSTYLTGDITVGLIWSVMAGATANYVYYWHCRERIGEIRKGSWADLAKRGEALKEAGGVQSYVIWIGVAFYIFFAISMTKMVQEGPPDGDRPPETPAKPAPASSV